MCWSCAAHRRWAVVDRIEHAVRRQQAMVPGGRTVLLTLTAAHEVRRLGGARLTRAQALADLRERLASGWRAFSLAIGKAYGFTPYVGVWEVTPGNDRKGHLHMHVVVQWAWRSWGEVCRMWREACPSSTRISMVASFDDRKTAARRSAEYLSKYLGKTRGRQDGRPAAGQWSPRLHAEVHAATYQLRWLFASKGHLPPREGICPGCGQHPERCDLARVWLESPSAAGWPSVWDMPDWWESDCWRQERLLE